MRPPITHKTLRRTQGSGSPSPNTSHNTTQIVDSATEKQKSPHRKGYKK